MTKKQFDELLKALKGVELALIEFRKTPQVVYVSSPSPLNLPPITYEQPYSPPTIPNWPGPNWPIITCGGTNTTKCNTEKYEVHS